MQGRAAFGGLVAALGARAARMTLLAAGEEDRPLRSVLVTFAGPLSGTATVRCKSLRVGKSAAMYATEIMGDDGLAATVNCAFGRSRHGVEVMAPDAVDLPDHTQLLSMPRGKNAPPMLPKFLSNLDIKWVGDGMPLSGTKDRRARIWVKSLQDVSAYPAERIISLCDMPPPVVLSHYTHWVPASSMTWSLEFVVPPEEVTSPWMFLDYSLEAAAGGYSQQSGKIYNEQGQLVALSHQCMTYFEPKPQK